MKSLKIADFKIEMSKVRLYSTLDAERSSFNKQPHGCPKHHSGDFGLTMPGSVNYISHRVSFKIEYFEIGSPALNRAYVFLATCGIQV